LPGPRPGAVALKYHVFSNSGFTHDFGPFATPYTRVGNWVGLFAAYAGLESVGSFGFSQISDNERLDWGSASSVLVTGAYDTGNTSPFTGDFSNQDYNQFISMSSNFLDSEMGGPPFDNPVGGFAGDVIGLDQNIDLYYPGADHILYIIWPDAGFYRVPETNNRADLSAYNADVLGDWFDWHKEVDTALRAQGNEFRWIPAGPVVAWILENESYVSGLTFDDLYVDSAPHGNENIYFLLGLVTFRTLYGSEPDLSGFTFPADARQMRTEFTANLDRLDRVVQERLEFHHANDIRVFADLE
jgi:hypothetical protein